MHHFLDHYIDRFIEHKDFEGLKERLGGNFFGVDPLPTTEKLHTVEHLHFLGSPIIVGTPKDALADITRAQNEGVTDMVIQMDIAGMAPELVRRSIRIFAEQVMPEFR